MEGRSSEKELLQERRRGLMDEKVAFKKLGGNCRVYCRMSARRQSELILA